MKLLSRKAQNKSEALVNLIAHHNPKSPITEQYRLIRTNIEFASVDKQIKSIVVTSPRPADGKSTIAANLAIVLAQQEKKVLLVDADLRKPSVHYTFNVNNLQGLTNMLTKQISLDNAVFQTNISNLNILTSGPIPPSPSELLNSRTMESTLEELKSKFDYIIFDTPPVLAVTDPQILASKCDGIVMVLSSGKTNKNEAIKTKELLQKTKTPLLGVVLNRFESKTNKYDYLYK